MTLVRPHLEKCVSVHVGEKCCQAGESAETIYQIGARTRGLSERERLCRLGFYSLERRRMRGDLIEVHKLMRGIDGVNTLPRVEESTESFAQSRGIKNQST